MTNPKPTSNPDLVELRLGTTVAPITPAFVSWLLDCAVSNGRLTEAERRSFDTLVQQHRHASTLSNWCVKAEALAAPGMVGNHSQSYGTFMNQVVDPMRVWITKETEEQAGRDAHLQAVARQRQDNEARAAGKPTRAEQETIDAQAAKDAAYLARFPADLPAPITSRYLSESKERQATEEVERAHRYKSPRKNLIEKG